MLSALTSFRRFARLSLAEAEGRLRVLAGRPPRFCGAWPNRAAALAAVPKSKLPGYDHEDIAEISFQAMCRVMPWDYPVLFWLQRDWRTGLKVLDAGGHMGTKYIAFDRVLPVGQAEWTVLDLPGIVAAARARQARGALPAALRFVTTPAEAGAADVFLASGLLQYLDVPLSDLLSQLPAPPRRIILNKVATRDGPTVVTLEQIGAARVPYQIRNRETFEAELQTLGYTVMDSWEIPELSHTIGTHPRLGPSTSRGYVLERGD